MKKLTLLPPLSKRFFEAMGKLGISGYKLAKEVPSISNATLTHIRNGRNEPSKTVIDDFVKRYPDINKTWLLTGEGKMLKNVITQNNVKGDNIQGNNFTVNKSQVDKFIDLLNAKDEQLNKSQLQIDRLIGIIEKFNK
ncbi:MAG: hypothetical protein LBG80_17035 [Bacteroidales bacterium]|jgi:hypothetical protein|nr:hypothetical protein [Bacteroidales bacterium]